MSVRERHYRGYLIKSLGGDLERMEIWYQGEYVTDATSLGAALRIIDDYHNAK